MAQNAAQAQGMNTNVTHVLNQNPDNVLNNVRVLADAHAKAGVRLVAGITQFLIVRAYHFDDAQRWPIDRSRDHLKTVLNERGLKRASVFRYIETGHKLAQLMVKRFGLGGTIKDILEAKDEGKGFELVLKCAFGLHFLPDASKPITPWLVDAEQKPRYSMDVLRVNLGLEQLDPTKQPGYKPPQAGPVDPNNPVSALGGEVSPGPVVKPNAGKADGIIARLKTDKDIIKKIPESVIMGAADVIGREKMAERLVKLMTIAEIMQLQTAIAERLKELAEHPQDILKSVEQPEGSTLPENEPATAKLPDVSPVDTPETEETETVSPRKRHAGKK